MIHLPRPEPNGDAWQNYVAESLDLLLAEREKRARWFSKQITLGNVLILGTLLVTLAFAWQRGEAHIADTAHVHWTATQLDDEIDKRDGLTQKGDESKLVDIALDVKDIKAQLAFFRSDKDVDWQRLKERVLILEQSRSRNWQPRNNP